MRSYRALVTVLHRDISRRVQSRRVPMRGRDAVCLATSLGCDYGEYNGISCSKIAQILMRTDGDVKATEREIRACDPCELNDVWDVVLRLEGRLRYVALQRGGHLASATIDQLVEWLRDRPYELWYAIRDGGLEYSVPAAVLELLPPSAVAVVLAATSEAGNCERVCDLLLREHVVPFMRARPHAELSDDWLRDNLGIEDLQDALALKRDRGAERPSADWLADAMASCEWHLVRNLRACGHEPSPEWLAAHLRHEMYAAMTGRFGEVAPDWLAEHVAPDMLYKALRHGGHLRRLSAEWILEKVRPSDVVSALIHSGAIHGMAREEMRAYLPVTSLCRALTVSDKIRGCDLAWLMDSVPKDTLYAAVLNADLIDGVSPEWLVERLPPRHAYLALCRNDRIRLCDRAWLIERFDGEDLYDALVTAGHDPRFDTTDAFAAAYRCDLVDVLHDLGELHAHGLADLSRHLSDHDVVRAAYGRPGVTPQALADVLQGYHLGEAVLDNDLCHGLDLGWLTENGVCGRQLLEVLQDNGGLDDIPADALVQLFRGAPLVDALELTGAHADLSDDELVDALRDHPEQARRAMSEFGRSEACDPEALARVFEDAHALGACVRETGAFRTMDPGDFERYGIVEGPSIKRARVA